MSNQNESASFRLAYSNTRYQTYIVMAGDSLNRIAQTLLKDERWADIIYDINRELIGPNRNRILPGQILNIPIPEVDRINERVDIQHTIDASGPKTLLELATFYYSIEKGFNADPGRFIRRIVKANHLAKYQPIYDDLPLRQGGNFIIPGVVKHQGVETELLYDFDTVNVWGRRWVNLMRSIKTSQEIAADQVDIATGKLFFKKGRVETEIDEIEMPDADNPVSNDVLPRTEPVSEPLPPPSEQQQKTIQLQSSSSPFEAMTSVPQDDVESASPALDNIFEDNDEDEIALPRPDINRAASKQEDDRDYEEIKISRKAKIEIDLSKRSNDPDPSGTDKNESSAETLKSLTPNDPQQFSTGSDPEFPSEFNPEDLVEPLLTEVPIDHPGPEGPAEHLKPLEVAQFKLIYNMLYKLGTFTSNEIGTCIASLTPPHWEPSYHHRTPPSALLRNLLREASADLDALENGLHQRQRYFDNEGNGRLTLQAETLYMADRLSADAMRPIQSLLPKPKTNLLTYYSENMHIRQVPYDDETILIGLPFISASSHNDQEAFDELTGFRAEILAQDQRRLPFDYMAIPHEIGHFLFHYGAVDGQKLETYLHQQIKQPGRFAGWFEEIFADTVGLFVAGPLAVLGLQAMFVDAFSQELIYDDGFHPVSVFRPFIMTEILREMSRHPRYPHKFRFALEKLDQNWEAVLHLRGMFDPDKSLNEVSFFFNSHENHLDPLAAHHFANRQARMAQRPLKRYLSRLSQDGGLDKATIPEVLAATEPMIKAFVDFIVMRTDTNGWYPWSADLPTADSPLSDYDYILEDLLYTEFPYDPIVTEYTPVFNTVYHIRSREAEKNARKWLNAWGDSGPGGWGANP